MAPSNPSPWHYLKGVAEPLGLTQVRLPRLAGSRAVRP